MAGGPSRCTFGSCPERRDVDRRRDRPARTTRSARRPGRSASRARDRPTRDRPPTKPMSGLGRPRSSAAGATPRAKCATSAPLGPSACSGFEAAALLAQRLRGGDDQVGPAAQLGFQSGQRARESPHAGVVVGAVIDDAPMRQQRQQVDRVRQPGDQDGRSTGSRRRSAADEWRRRRWPSRLAARSTRQRRRGVDPAQERGRRTQRLSATGRGGRARLGELADEARPRRAPRRQRRLDVQDAPAAARQVPAR